MNSEILSIKSADDLIEWTLLGAMEFKPGVHKIYMKRKNGSGEYLQIATIKTELLKHIFGLSDAQYDEEF